MYFFARVTKEKGIEDLLEAISIVRNKIPNIQLTVIGGCNLNYLTFLNSKCLQLRIEQNVKFLGFLATQEDIYRYLIQAKMCVLPTYHDIIPGTIIESMLIKLPVVAYAVGGIPELNSKVETIGLVKKGDIFELANKILHFYLNDKLRLTLANSAYLLALDKFSNKNITQDIYKAYYSILNK